MEQLLETSEFQQTSGPTLRRLCGAFSLIPTLLLEAATVRRSAASSMSGCKLVVMLIAGLESSAIPARYISRNSHHFPKLQCLDGVWGIPRKVRPATVIAMS